jgi:hypothetical protein
VANLVKGKEVELNILVERKPLEERIIHRSQNVNADPHILIEVDGQKWYVQPVLHIWRRGEPNRFIRKTFWESSGVYTNMDFSNLVKKLAHLNFAFRNHTAFLPTNESIRKLLETAIRKGDYRVTNEDNNEIEIHLTNRSLRDFTPSKWFVTNTESVKSAIRKQK